MSVQVDWDFAGDDDAKAEIAAAVRHLLKDATGGERGDIVREIIEIVQYAANEQAGGEPREAGADERHNLTRPMSSTLPARYGSVARQHPQD